MPIELDCPSCGAGLRLKRADAIVECPACRNLVAPPDPNEVAKPMAPPIHKRGIPGWLGPVVGPILGILLVIVRGGRILAADNGENTLLILAAAAGVGFLGGMIVFVMDLVNRKSSGRSRR